MITARTILSTAVMLIARDRTLTIWDQSEMIQALSRQVHEYGRTGDRRKLARLRASLRRNR